MSRFASHLATEVAQLPHMLIQLTPLWRSSTTPFRSLVQSSLVNSPLKPQAFDNQQPLPMRLSHFFVVVAAAFLATGALADTSVASVSEPSHRNLRKHHTIEDEERGIKDISLERLQSLGRRVGVNADDILDDAAAAMRTMTHTQQKEWIAGINKLKKIYKSAKASHIKPN